MAKTTLHKIGKDYVKVLRSKMELLGIYEEGDDLMILNDIGLQYQLYKHNLEKSLVDPDDKVIQTNMQRHYSNVMNMVHKLGLTPMARLKNKQPEKEDKEDNVFDKLDNMFNNK